MMSRGTSRVAITHAVVAVSLATAVWLVVGGWRVVPLVVGAYAVGVVVAGYIRPPAFEGLDCCVATRTGEGSDAWGLPAVGSARVGVSQQRRRG